MESSSPYCRFPHPGHPPGALMKPLGSRSFTLPHSQAPGSVSLRRWSVVAKIVESSAGGAARWLVDGCSPPFAAASLAAVEPAGSQTWRSRGRGRDSPLQVAGENSVQALPSILVLTTSFASLRARARLWDSLLEGARARGLKGGPTFPPSVFASCAPPDSPSS